MSSLWADVRFACRSLVRSPGFALVSISVLAIGIGAVTVMFSTLNAVVLRPLPFREPERLIWCWSVPESGRDNSTAAMDYFDYRERNDVFSSLAAHLVFRPPRIVTGKGEPERIDSTVVSADFFSTLGIHPLHGRTFLPEEEVSGPNVVIISYGFWKRKLGGNPAAVGRPMTIDGDSFEIVGILPREFSYPEEVELWFPMRRGGPWETSRGNRNFFVIGRLKDDVTIDRAQVQMVLIASELEEENPDANRGWSVRLEPLHERLVGDIRRAMWILMGAVTLVLLTACANLSSLFLAKTTARHNELALRRSLGASRWAMIRQLLVESLTITSLGALSGVALAFLGVDLVKTLAPVDVTRLDTVSIDMPVLVFSAAASVVTGILFGIVPALRSTHVDLVHSLKQGAQTTETGASLRTRSVLVAVQVGLSVVLLIGSGLLIRSLYRLRHVDPGFDPGSVLTMEVQLPTVRYGRPVEQEQFFADLLERIRVLPGVLDAGAVSRLPLRGGFWNYVYPADRPPRDPSEQLSAVRRRVMEGYFRTLRIPLVAGRTFEPTDRPGSRAVVVVSKTLAQRSFPGQSAIGRTLVLPGWGADDGGLYLEIIGVVDDVKDDGLGSESRPVFYLPYRQLPIPVMKLAIRAADEPTRLAPAVRDAVWDLDDDVPVSDTGTLEGEVSRSTASERFQTLLLSAFAFMALVLTAVGLYGVLTYFVSQRRRELGIRLALGATGPSVIYEVVQKGLSMVLGGIVIGVPGGLAASRFLESLLFETAGTEPLAYVLVCSILFLVAIGACVLPAVRAVRLDPVQALKTE